MFQIHMMSHYMHYDKNIHEIGIHACGYLMAYTVYFALKRETGYSLSKYQKAKIFLASIIDIIVFSSIRNLYSIATGLSVLGNEVMYHDLLCLQRYRRVNVLTNALSNRYCRITIFAKVVSYQAKHHENFSIWNSYTLHHVCGGKAILSRVFEHEFLLSRMGYRMVGIVSIPTSCWVFNI